MPILLVFALLATCLPLEWPAPLVGGGLATAVNLTAISVALSLLLALIVRLWVVRTLSRNPSRKMEVVQGYSRLRRILFFLNLSLVALCVLVFGWGWATQQVLVMETADALVLAPFAELAVALPYFLILFGAWVIYYDADYLLHRTTLLGPVDRPFWTRAGYFFSHLRQFLLLVMLPVLLFVTQQTLSRIAPETTRSDWYRMASVAAVPLLVLVMPLLIKPLLGLGTLPAGLVRDRLEMLAKRLHFRYSDFLLWPTHGASAYAMIVGLIPQVRYVIFTDRILDDLPMNELEAVFGHEVGHAKHGHIWLYAVFLTLSMTVLAALLLLIGQQLDAAGVEVPKWAEGWLALPPVILAGSYVFLVFGFLSRRCERQADVYGCRAVSCVDPACRGHDLSTVYPERASGLCPTGIRTFVRALERVGIAMDFRGSDTANSQRSVGSLFRRLFGWLKAWQHSTMPRRIEFLLSLIDEPGKEQRFQRRVTLLRWGLIIGLVVVLLGLGQAVGWQDFLQAM